MTHYDWIGRRGQIKIKTYVGTAARSPNARRHHFPPASGQIATTIENAVDEQFQVTEPITDRTTTYQYDGLLRLQTTTRTVDLTQSSASDINRQQRHTYSQVTGRLIAETDPLGRQTAYGYDDLGRIASTTENCQLVESGCTAFNGANTADRNRTTALRYDARGRVVATIDPVGQVTRTVYDALDRPIARILNEQRPPRDPATTDVNVTTRTSYDALGRVTAETDPLGAVARTGYDGLSHVTSRTDWVAASCARATMGAAPCAGGWRPTTG